MLTESESKWAAVLKSKRQFTLMESQSVKGSLSSATGSHTNVTESEIWKFGSIINTNFDEHWEKFRWHYVRFRALWPTVNILFMHSLTSYLSHSLILKRAKVEVKTFMFILCTVRTYWHLIEQISNFSLNASPREITFCVFVFVLTKTVAIHWILVRNESCRSHIILSRQHDT